ncbi:hypothetical protein GCM10008983_00410 [Lentibacillus halophilus]|uniref:Uncharacterized protein n=1 Tax=Lentibacillus halophilus TaxID=295065 RepID=A0ABP3IUL0_9BACI
MKHLQPMSLNFLEQKHELLDGDWRDIFIGNTIHLIAGAISVHIFDIGILGLM